MFFNILSILILEAKQTLIDTVQNLRDTLQDPEKVQGRLTRDDKVRPDYCITVLYNSETWIYYVH